MTTWMYVVRSSPVENFPLETPLTLLPSSEEYPEEISARMLVDYPELVQRLWNAKDNIGRIWRIDRGKLYTRLRNEIFPQDRSGSDFFRNRAGDKLHQVLDAAKISLPENFNFVDLAGGPGAFSQVLLAAGGQGWGMTLRGSEDSLAWYKDLLRVENFQPIWGASGTGNLYLLEDIVALTKTVLEATNNQGVQCVVADGGLSVEGADNYQEILSGRLILGEFAAMMGIISQGGHFVCKFFDTFSHLSKSLIYLATLLFRNVLIIKPASSRQVNSERYLVGRFRRERSSLMSEIHRQLLQAVYECSMNPGNTPETLAKIAGDRKFQESIDKPIREIAERQIEAIDQIANRAQNRR